MTLVVAAMLAMLAGTVDTVAASALAAPTSSAVQLQENRTKGQAGFCIDTKTDECDGADVKTGFCEGASHIKCCPTSKVKGVDDGSDDQTGGDDGYAYEYDDNS
eukprot:gene8274-35311_t